MVPAFSIELYDYVLCGSSALGGGSGQCCPPSLIAQLCMLSLYDTSCVYTHTRARTRTRAHAQYTHSYNIIVFLPWTFAYVVYATLTTLSLLTSFACLVPNCTSKLSQASTPVGNFPWLPPGQVSAFFNISHLNLPLTLFVSIYSCLSTPPSEHISLLWPLKNRKFEVQFTEWKQT